MLYVSSILFAASAVLFAFFVMDMLDSRPRSLMRSLGELRRSGLTVFETSARPDVSRVASSVLLHIGEHVMGSAAQREALRDRLSHAGYRSANSVSMYWGLRAVLAIGLATFGFIVAPVAHLHFAGYLFLSMWLGLLGWLGPSMYLGRIARRRESEIRSALPDALDLLIVCIDAGLGMNQAWVRVAEEIQSVSPALSDELSLVNFQIRAGVPREEAMRNLGQRTQIADLRSLSAILIQTDRFGTSVSQALRVQSDSLRSRRQQRAEEAAAKTPIKLSFPLVLCLMPALFAVLLGGSIVQLLESFANLN